MNDLPWMGLGLSSNLGPADRPDPWHIHRTRRGLLDYVEYSAPLSIHEARAEAPGFSTLFDNRGELPAIFHPVHLNLWGPELEPKEDLERLREHLNEVGSPWVGNDVGWWHHGGRPFPGYLYLPPPFTREAVDGCVAHALHVQEAIDVPLLVENPAVLARNGDLHVLDFMAELHRRTGLPLLLDLGHLLSYQLTWGLPLSTGLDGFPLDRVVEIHIAGGVVTRWGERSFYVDDHTQPVREELFELLEKVLPRCTGLKAVTFEADGHPEPIAIHTLERLRRLVPPRNGSEVPMGTGGGGMPAAVGAAGLPLEGAGATSAASAGELPSELPALAWEVWSQAFAGAETTDPDGQRADMDFRLALVAQEIDRDWPLSRLLLAPSREELSAFTADPLFRQAWEGAGGDLGASFFSWARRKLREQPNPGGEAVLSFEAWSQGLLAQRRPGQSGLRLAQGVAPGAFPVDLSETVFAAATLRRHLGDRAWASGLLETSGLDTLGQVASRPARGPWQVVLLRRRGRLEVAPVEPGIFQALGAISRGAGESVPEEVLEVLVARGWVVR